MFYSPFSLVLVIKYNYAMPSINISKFTGCSLEDTKKSIYSICLNHVIAFHIIAFSFRGGGYDASMF